MLSSNLQLCADNKPIKHFYAEQLENYLVRYKTCVKKLEKYNSEATIFTTLIQQWHTFSKSMYYVAGSVKYIALSWQELAKNLSYMGQKLANDDLDENDFNYKRQQFRNTYQDFRSLAEKAKLFQKIESLDINVDNRILNLVPRLSNLKNPKLKQVIILKNY